MMTGPRVRSTFRHGWAVAFSGIAHYFVRFEAGVVVSACGKKQGLAGRLFESGDWTRCKVCARMMEPAG